MISQSLQSLFFAVIFLLALVHAIALPAPGPPPQRPTFSVYGYNKPTSPYFNGQHIYGNAPNVANKPINTIILPDQHVELQHTPSGNLESTHPVNVQEFRKGVPQAPRSGTIKVSEGKFGDINHFAGCYRKRSPGACTGKSAASALNAGKAAGKTASTLGKVGKVLGGPEAAIAMTAADNAALGYQTSAKYNEMLKNKGRDYEQATKWRPPQASAAPAQTKLSSSSQPKKRTDNLLG